MPHIRALAALAATIICVGLSACAGPSPVEIAPLTAADAASLKAKGKAIVVVSAAVQIEALWNSTGQLEMMFSKRTPDRKLDFGNILVVDKHPEPGKPQISEIAAGDYDMQSFSYGAHNMKYSNSAGLLGVPLGSFSVAAGEVVYLGHVVVAQEKSIVVQSKPRFDLRVVDHRSAAEPALRARAPGLETQLQNRLMTVSPLLSLAKP